MFEELVWKLRAAIEAMAGVVKRVEAGTIAREARRAESATRGMYAIMDKVWRLIYS
jgi:hypothetical protein